MHPRLPGGKTDWTRAIPCQCQRERIDKERRDNLLKFCRLPAATEKWTFENFKTYSPNLKEALAAAREIAMGEGIKWLTLISKVERGKSHLAVAICREWLKRGIPARYVFVPELLDELRAGQNNDADWSFLSRMQFYKTVPLLVMDDLGSEKPSAWVTEKLVTIINSRGENGLHLVVTTNKALDNLPGDDECRIGSRLRRDEHTVIVIDDCMEYSIYRKKK